MIPQTKSRFDAARFSALSQSFKAKHNELFTAAAWGEIKDLDIYKNNEDENFHNLRFVQMYEEEEKKTLNSVE